MITAFDVLGQKEMLSWSRLTPFLLLNIAQGFFLRALAKFLLSQAGRPTCAPYDPKIAFCMRKDCVEYLIQSITNNLCSPCAPLNIL
jgi:hypothetical protein